MPTATVARRLLLSLMALLFAVPAFAQLTTLETDDLRLVYLAPTQSYLAPHVARCFTNSLRFHTRLFDFKPSEKVTLLMNDFSDSGNASATAVPRDSLRVELSPLSFAFETIVANERMNMLLNHELVHIATVDQSNGRDRTWRTLFGGKVNPEGRHPESILWFYLTAPRDSAPRWYHEGIAVFLDTFMAGGLGRAQGAYDEMVFRSMVKDDARFYDPLGLAAMGTKVDFQTEVNSYLYGTRFMTWVADRYGPDKLMLWVGRGKDSHGYYASQFKHVFGVTLDAAWQDWVTSEHEFQQQNLAAVRKYPVTPYTDLSKHALGSVSRTWFDAKANRIYAGVHYQGVVSHIASISVADGSIERIVDIKEPVLYRVSSVAFDPASRTIFYTTDNKSFRDLVSVNADTHEWKLLQKDARVGDLVVDPVDHGLWGIRHFNGICTLVKIPAPYTDWKQVFTWPYGTVPYDLDISPDGKLLSASFGEIDGKQTLRVLDLKALAAGDATALKTFEFGSAVPANFVFSPDGAYLYGSSYYTGVSNIFRIDLASGKLDAVTNSETGFFRPIPLAGNRLLVLRYTGLGFVPATIEATPIEDVAPITFFGQQVVTRHPELKQWMIPPPGDIPLDSMIRKQEPYKAFGSIGLESFYPVVEGYKDLWAAGLAVNLSDPLMLDRARIAASYSPGGQLESKERLHVSADFERYDWKVRYRYNPADFYDLFGPTKTSLKGWSVGVGYHKNLVYDMPVRMDLTVDTDYYGGLERLPGYQNVASPADTLWSTSVRLEYHNVRSSIGRVDDEKGWSWKVLVAQDRTTDGTFPKLAGAVDVALFQPFAHSAVWLRTAAGVSAGDRANAFANFYFGAFGNNWVDHGSVKRYHDLTSFPGLEINEVGGKDFGRAMLEWNLPPLRFARFGTPGFYCPWVRASLFTGGLLTDHGNAEFRRTVTDVGTQLDFALVALSRLDMTLSLGYAAAFEGGAPRRDEFMLSLKIFD